MKDKIVADVQLPFLSIGGHQLQQYISFKWLQGEQWCVTGPSGSGKTTLLKAISGMIFVPKSQITFPILEDIKKNSGGDILVSDMIAFVPQEVRVPSGFLPDMYYQRRYQAAEQDDIPSVREVLSKQQNGDDELVVGEVSDIMSLRKLWNQPFVQLSNGQTRRLMIAIALMKKPEVLILDNPYTGLDHAARASLNSHIKRLIDNGLHTIIAAHEHELDSIGFVTNILKLNYASTYHKNDDLPEFYKSNSSSSEVSPIMMKDVKVRYGDKVIINIENWKVKPNQRWFIQGANGSGKSTLLSLIVADHPQAYSNEVVLFGKKRGTGESIWDIKRRLGYFSSELLRYFSSQSTSADIIASGWSDNASLDVSKISEQQKALVFELSAWLGLDSLLGIKFGSLSFSQQKMILIARAMIRNPELLILDEPLQGMDEDWREVFKNKLDLFSRNRTVLYVTHDIEEIPPGDWFYLNL